MVKIKKSHEQGRTIVETLAYIMVMIAVTVGVAALVSQGYYKYESSSIQQELNDLKKTIATRYAVDGQYANVKWDDLCEDQIGPRSLMPNRDCESEKCKCEVQRGRHSFDGPVNIGPADCNASNTFCETFFIEFDELPQDICNQLGAKAWDTVSGSDIERMSINDTVWGWPHSPISELGNAKEFPALIQEVSKACKEGDENTIIWYFN